MKKIYMIVSSDEYELPEIVSESIVEMARRLGRNYQSLRSDFCKGSKPKTLNLISDRINVSAGSIARKETRSAREDRGYKDEKRVVAETSRRFNVWHIGRGKNMSKHPAVFPYELAADHIKSWSNEGDVVLDPFSGSGTTCIAASNLGRKFIGFEIDQEYYDESLSVINEVKKQVKLF
jgi:site-specific DNA-methyltransferase (adenine-specific)